MTEAFAVTVKTKEAEDFLKDQILAHVENYTIAKKMPFGYFIQTLDGVAIHVAPGEVIPPGMEIRRPTREESQAVEHRRRVS